VEIRCVLFDLGGVLVELGGVRDLGEMIGEPDDGQVWARWLGSEVVRAYERGRCSTAECAVRMVEELALDTTPDAFAERFRAWPRGLFPGARELVEGLAERLQVACLSNSNELHWSHQAGAFELDRLFPTRFLSHEMGLIKPDLDVYLHVVERLALEPEAILFLDDNQPNVDAARSAGLRAERVQGPQHARTVLRRFGILGR
jgi:putative hydrolase of the HAD superfamily